MDNSCSQTTAGPGSEVCVPNMAFWQIPATQMVVATGALGIVWICVIIALKVIFFATSKTFCGKGGEIVQHLCDSLLSLFSAVAFLWSAIALTEGVADRNQGQNILESVPEASALRYRIGIVSSFCFFSSACCCSTRVLFQIQLNKQHILSLTYFCS